MLTDDEIMAAGYNSGDPDGVLEFGKNVIAAYEAKLREQNEPKGYLVYFDAKICGANVTDRLFVWRESEAANQVRAELIQKVVPVFEHPAPIPEGFDAWSLNPYTIALQKIMETENHGQDISLLQVLRKFRNRLLQSQPAPIPEGYQLVPIEPTYAMLKAAEKEWPCGSAIDMAVREYKAMLAAARRGE